MANRQRHRPHRRARLRHRIDRARRSTLRNDPTDPGSSAAGPDIAEGTHRGELMPASERPHLLAAQWKGLFAAGPSAYGGTHGGGPSHFFDEHAADSRTWTRWRIPSTDPQELLAALCHSDGVAAERTVWCLTVLAQQRMRRGSTRRRHAVRRLTADDHLPPFDRQGSGRSIRYAASRSMRCRRRFATGRSPSSAHQLSTGPAARSSQQDHVWYRPTATTSGIGVATGGDRRRAPRARWRGTGSARAGRHRRWHRVGCRKVTFRAAERVVKWSMAGWSAPSSAVAPMVQCGGCDRRRRSHRSVQRALAARAAAVINCSSTASRPSNGSAARY